MMAIIIAFLLIYWLRRLAYLVQGTPNHGGQEMLIP